MSICVIIAAWNAHRTIGRAIASALAQAEVSEVIVVDDASQDTTALAVLDADDGTNRLALLRHVANRGPSAARNLALEHSRAPFIAVLDADDYLLPGRFSPLLEVGGWDLIADNIAFVPEDVDATGEVPVIKNFADPPRPLPLRRFLAGTLVQRSGYRAELGFLKPVIRRAWLDQHGARYDETLRLGEDFMLYASVIAAGARFLTVHRCGYVAVVRGDSISGNHATANLAALLAAVDRWAATITLSADERAMLDNYRTQLSANFRHRRLLDDKRHIGLTRGLLGLLDEPLTLPRVAARVIADKLAVLGPKPAPMPSIRYLLSE